MGTIDDYLAGLAPADAAIIGHMYDLAREVAPDVEQGLGMPALTYRGKALLSVMRAKAHIGVYPFSPAAITEIDRLLDGVDRAKGTIRFDPTSPLPDETIRALVRARMTQIEGS